MTACRPEGEGPRNAYPLQPPTHSKRLFITPKTLLLEFIDLMRDRGSCRGAPVWAVLGSYDRLVPLL